ncbi:unnamed protein product [Protopolystoma xenopodis]|uniref:Uncharacterized protein n=1 Tax=Protopolystoma xenopodis TaxID=117903 RepID=A0A3S5BBY9_9PLAT|nr:unnamed protein product [Protopolystoma xenopodis]
MCRHGRSEWVRIRGGGEKRVGEHGNSGQADATRVSFLMQLVEVGNFGEERLSDTVGMGQSRRNWASHSLQKRS